MLEISYLGHAAFKIKCDQTTIILDPFDPKFLTGFKWTPQEADLVLVTHQHGDHNFAAGVTGNPFVIDGPGEYEIKGVNVFGIGSFHDKNKGEERGINTMYLIETGDIVLAHLGDLGHIPDEAQFKELERADILMLPVGGFYTIDAKAAKQIIEHINPSIVIPMHYQVKETYAEKLESIEKFLKEIEVEPPEAVEKLKIKSRADLPEETQVVAMSSPQVR